jgi:hypothetical protein
MVILGLLLLAVGVIVILAGIFTGQVSGGHVELLDVKMSVPTVFVVGVAAGACVLWGFGILKYGTKRGLRQRREHRRLAELSEKLDRVEAERRGDDEPKE